MTTKKKVTKKELQQIQDQQTQLNGLQNNVAVLELRKLEYVDEVRKTAKEISELKKKLEKKYGSVNISLETGEITPIENEQDNTEN